MLGDEPQPTAALLVFRPAPDFDQAASDLESVVYRMSRVKLVRFLITFAIFVPLFAVAAAVSLYMMSLFSVLFFGGVSLLALIVLPLLFYSLFDRRPKLVLCREGLFEHTTFDQQFIAWERICAVRFESKRCFPLGPDSTMHLDLLTQAGETETRSVDLNYLSAKPADIMKRVEQWAAHVANHNEQLN